MMNEEVKISELEPQNVHAGTKRWRRVFHGFASQLADLTIGNHYSFDREALAIDSNGVDENEYSQRQYTPEGRPVEPTFWQKVKKFFAPVGVALLICLKFLAKFKFLLPFLKTGATMLISIWAYALAWGWQFAVGFVLLIFVHE